MGDDIRMEGPEVQEEKDWLDTGGNQGHLQDAVERLTL